ncbi:MAG: hypothetical protein PHE20_03670 [Patescibacteria group bacterium]|nr:hypothetical protein [Patescibacteria group bacterium]
MSFEKMDIPTSPDNYDMEHKDKGSDEDEHTEIDLLFEDVTGKKIEEAPDENAEQDIYEFVDNGEKIESGPELDKFGFVQVLEDYFEKVNDNKKEEFLKRTNEFLTEYRKILDNAKDEKSALKDASNAFYKIIGKEITGYDENGKIFFDLERARLIRVRNKKAPIDAIRVKYDKNGRPQDPSKASTFKMAK